MAKEQVALRGEKFGLATWCSNFSLRWVEGGEGMGEGVLKGNGKKCNRKRTITRKKNQSLQSLATVVCFTGLLKQIA